MAVKADEFANAVNKVIQDYEGATITVMQNAVDKASKEAVKKLKSSSPKASGAYAKSWASKKTKMANKWAYEKTEYNKEHYRLTHLLDIQLLPLRLQLYASCDAVPVALRLVCHAV